MYHTLFAWTPRDQPHVISLKMRGVPGYSELQARKFAWGSEFFRSYRNSGKRATWSDRYNAIDIIEARDCYLFIGEI